MKVYKHKNWLERENCWDVFLMLTRQAPDKWKIMFLVSVSLTVWVMEAGLQEHCWTGHFGKSSFNFWLLRNKGTSNPELNSFICHLRVVINILNGMLLEATVLRHKGNWQRYSCWPSLGEDRCNLHGKSRQGSRVYWFYLEPSARTFRKQQQTLNIRRI